MTTKRPFRLTLKPRSASTEVGNDKSKKKNAGAYVHPLAGQQDLLRQQYGKAASVATPGQDQMRSAIEEDSVLELDKEEAEAEDDRLETMSTTNGWFASSLRDDESLLSRDSPTESTFEGQSSLYSSVKEILQEQQRLQESGGSDTEPSFLRPSETQQTILAQKNSDEMLLGSSSRPHAATSAATSPVREGGIFRRLKRISKKEKSEQLSNANGDDVDPPLLVGEREAGPSSSPLIQSPSRILTESDLRDANMDVTLLLKDAALKKIPNVQRPANSRIQSVQPSLVDGESIREMLSRPHSPSSDEEDEEGEGDMRRRMETRISKSQSIHSQAGLVDTLDDEEWDEDGDETTGPLTEQYFSDRQSTTSDYRSITTSSEYDDAVTAEDEDDDVLDDDDDLLVDVDPVEPTLHEASRADYIEASSRRLSSQLPMASRMAAMHLHVESQTPDEDDEGARTPRAVAEGEQASYFNTDAPSISSAGMSVYSLATASTSTPTREAPPPTYSWYQEAKLSAQQRHYFLRHIVSRELAWEFERLYLLKSSASLTAPSPPHTLPASDLSYFKPHAKEITPDLPLMRLLFRCVLSTCPLFGPAQPIEGSAAIRARKLGAKKFIDEALLPLLRFRQANVLSCSTDLHGEWPGELFDAPTSTGAMLGSTFKLLTRLFMALLPDRSSQAWSWSSVPSPPSGAFLDHRVAPNKLKQGGMEVNIAGARIRPSSKECELLLSVKRFGFPACYVVRTESDFYEFATGLAEELGRRSRVRPVPPPPGHEASTKGSAREDRGDGTEEGSLRSNSPKKVAHREILFSKPNSSQSSLQSSESASKGRSVPQEGNEAMYKLPRRNRSSTSFSSTSSPRLGDQSPLAASSNGHSVGSSRGPANAAATASSTVSSSPRFFYRTNRTASSADMNASHASLDNSSSAHGTESASEAVSTGKTSATSATTTTEAPVTHDIEARRKQLRAWLRDALSVRGAGHANETKQFLNSGSFLEKEIKAATKKDVQRRAEIDAAMMKERENSAMNAPDEIIELHSEMQRLWKDCVEGDGLLQAYEAVKERDTFSSLPLPYQRAISWTNLKVACFLHHIFLNSHEARNNFDRATELMQCIPWKALSLAMKEPTGLMMQKVKSTMSQEFILKKILALHLDDVPARKVDLEVSSLKKRLGSTIVRKLQGYVESPDWQRRVIRKASKKNGIPLVAAIVRGDDKPLLAAEGIKRIVSATKIYQDFMNTLPTYEERRAKIKANAEVRLIVDMQRALRLLSLKRDGQKVRAGLEQELLKPIQAFLDPIFSLLKRLHRSRVLNKALGDGKDVVTGLQSFIFKLMDVLAGLKMRVQDPWRSLSTLTLFLDDAIPSWYRFLHRFAKMDGLLLDLTLWLKSITSLLDPRSDRNSNLLLEDSFRTTASINVTAGGGGGGGGGGRTSQGGGAAKTSKMDRDQVTKRWQPPKGGFNSSDLSFISEFTTISRKKKAVEMEMACRWAAGDTDADHSIQLFGEGGGKTRMTPIRLPPLPSISTKAEASLQVYLPGFRSALSHFM